MTAVKGATILAPSFSPGQQFQTATFKKQETGEICNRHFQQPEVS